MAWLGYGDPTAARGYGVGRGGCGRSLLNEASAALCGVKEAGRRQASEEKEGRRGADCTGSAAFGQV